MAQLLRPYVTTASLSRSAGIGEFFRRPAGVVHAKVAGSALTACGISSASWAKFLHLAFGAQEYENCARCAQALRQGVPQHWQRLLADGCDDASEPTLRDPLSVRLVHGPHLGWAWIAVAPNNKVVAEAAQHFADPESARSAAQDLIERVRLSEIEVRTVAGKRCRWLLVLDGTVVGRSATRAFVSAHAARTSGLRLREQIAGAVIDGDATHEEGIS